MKSSAPSLDEVRTALQASSGAFLFVGVFSLFINLLMLVPALYMLQVYDRVLSSKSENTLLMLTILAVGLFGVMGVLDLLRARILVRISTRLDMALDARLFRALFNSNLRGRRTMHAQPLQDLTTLRQFLTGSGPLAFFDVPWMPVYLAVLFLLHPSIGWVSVAGALVLVALAVANEYATRGPINRANALAVTGANQVAGNLRNIEAIESMGMLSRVYDRWSRLHRQILRLQSLASDRSGLLTSLSKSLRITLQSIILGVGAYLAIEQIVTPGVMIAGSILMGRALAPIDQLIASWKGFLGAREAYARLRELLTAVPAPITAMRLPPPTGAVSLDDVVASPPGTSIVVLRRISLRIAAGEAIGVIGPSAAGKSTLARVLIGVWPALAGTVRLDGADIGQWNRDELGPYIGYLPQDVELLDGSVAENIARFGTLDADDVVAAARWAGVHEIILQLPRGYDTAIGEGGAVLSGGQRQRIGLARALYGHPRLVVLDEPNANLDDAGELALIRGLGRLKAARTTVIVISHRPSVLEGVDKLLVLKDGAIDTFGPREQVINRFIRPAALAHSSKPTP